MFANYAKHYKTGEPIPAALVEKIKKAQTFNQGFATTEYLAAALLDMAWHTLPADAAPQDVNAFEADALKRFKIDMDAVPPRYHTTYFLHIWGGGYAAGRVARVSVRVWLAPSRRTWIEIVSPGANSLSVASSGWSRSGAIA